jgi:carbon-monoxide dehydrogenase medium subunit
MSLNAHPVLPEFDYIRPQTLQEASQFLAAHPGEARPLLGGTDIFVRMRDGAWHDKYLVDVKCLDGMRDLHYDPVDGLLIGAAVSMNRVIASPIVKEKYAILGEAASSCASYQLRNRATIVGNICNASPAGDTLGASLLLDAVLNVHGPDGTREEPLNTLFLGPGKTRLRPGDIVTSVRLPVPPTGMRGKYIKLGRNRKSDLAIVGVTALGWHDSTLPSRLRIRLALASVAPVPLIVDAVEAILAEKKIDEEDIAEAAEAAMQACEPIDDVRGSARYRRYMVRNLSARALTQLWHALKS